MNHLFEYLRKHNGQTGDSSSDSIEAAWANITHSPDQEESGDLERIPVEEVLVEAASRIVFHGDPSSPGADRFRLLRMRLRDIQNQTKLRSLLVTSPLPHDGKSTMALNLTTALAQRGKSRVLLIEGDLHHACLSSRLGLKAQAGLSECIESALDPLSAIRRLEPLGWYLLAAGQPRRNPTELLQAEALSGTMQKLRPYFDWIVIDSPPVLPLTDALLLQQQADASLLVARAGRTPSDAVDEAVALLGRKHVLGIVLNCAERLGRLYSTYYYAAPYYNQRGSTEWKESKKNQEQPLIRGGQ